MADRERIVELYRQGQEHERDFDLEPACRLLTAALDGASAAGLPEIVRSCRQLLGVVAHKADRLDETRAHLEVALALALNRATARTRRTPVRSSASSCSTKDVPSSRWPSSPPRSPSPPGS